MDFLVLFALVKYPSLISWVKRPDMHMLYCSTHFLCFTSSECWHGCEDEAGRRQRRSGNVGDRACGRSWRSKQRRRARGTEFPRMVEGSRRPELGLIAMRDRAGSHFGVQVSWSLLRRRVEQHRIAGERRMAGRTKTETRRFEFEFQICRPSLKDFQCVK
jgi:hypothetical protein